MYENSHLPVYDPLEPEMAVAMTFRWMMDANAHTLDDENTLAARLRVVTKAVEEGDLSHVRRILASQMMVLERLFHHMMAKSSFYKTDPANYERFLKLATRAQTQMARTAAILQHMKNSAERTRPKQKPVMAAVAAATTTERVPQQPPQKDRDDVLRG